MPNKTGDDEILAVLSAAKEFTNNKEITVSECRANMEIALEFAYKKLSEEEAMIRASLTKEMRQWIQVCIFAVRKILDVAYEKAMFLKRLEAAGMGELPIKDIPDNDLIFIKGIKRIEAKVRAAKIEDTIVDFDQTEKWKN